MRLVLAGVTTTLALAFAAPVASAALPDAGAVASTAGSATSAATPATSAATGLVDSTAGAVERQANAAAAPAQEPASKAVAPAKDTVARTVAPAKEAAAKAVAPAKDVASNAGPPTGGVGQTAGAVEQAVARAAQPGQGVQPAVGRELGRQRDRIAHALPELPAVGSVDDVLTTLGTTLRQIAPVGDLLAPVAPLLREAGLLGGAGLLDELPDLVAVVSPRDATPPLTSHRPPSAGILGAGTAPSGAPPTLPAAAPTTTASHSFQAASAGPPAAEVGGRPVSPPPRTAPAPVAGGATAVFSGAGFVPFLGLLVLAALVLPRLMRRLDELPAFVRPEPFLCALERPG